MVSELAGRFDWTWSSPQVLRLRSLPKNQIVTVGRSASRRSQMNQLYGASPPLHTIARLCSVALMMTGKVASSHRLAA